MNALLLQSSRKISEIMQIPLIQENQPCSQFPHPSGNGERSVSYTHLATNVYNNLTEVSYALLPTIRIRLRTIAKSVPFESTSSEFQSRTKGIRPKTKIVMICLLYTSFHSYTGVPYGDLHDNLCFLVVLTFALLPKLDCPYACLLYTSCRALKIA